MATKNTGRSRHFESDENKYVTFDCFVRVLTSTSDPILERGKGIKSVGRAGTGKYVVTGSTLFPSSSCVSAIVQCLGSSATQMFQPTRVVPNDTAAGGWTLTFMSTYPASGSLAAPVYNVLAECSASVHVVFGDKV